MLDATPTVHAKSSFQFLNELFNSQYSASVCANIYKPVLRIAFRSFFNVSQFMNIAKSHNTTVSPLAALSYRLSIPFYDVSPTFCVVQYYALKFLSFFSIRNSLNNELLFEWFGKWF